MNWLQKISSVSFWLDGSQKISQPKTISDLANDLQKFASDRIGFFLSVHTITPDGTDFDQMTGTINWYVTDRVPVDQQRRIMFDWSKEMELLDYKISIAGPQVSGMSRPRDPPLMVYRVRVLQNGSEDYMQIPELNASNDNAKAFMEALGVPFDWSGSISLGDMKTKLEMFAPYQQQDLVIPTYDDQGEQRARTVNFGRNEDQVQWYVDQMTRIVDFGLQNGFNTLVWG